MPTNVTPEYRAAEQRFKAATDPEEQLAALQEMLSTVPKHKGTEKLQADIKRRISVLRKQPSARKRGGHRPGHHVERAEGGQTALVGPPNSGKSLLLSRLTGAPAAVADYPFSTHVPQPGMMPFEDVHLQLVDLPPVAPAGTEPWVYELARCADLVLLVVDASDPDVLSRLDEVVDLLAAHHAEPEAADARPPIVVASKVDLPGASDNADALAELVADRWPVLRVSSRTGEGLEDLRREVFRALAVIRVYTKAPGQPARRDRPFLVAAGSTVETAAAAVHRDIASRLRFARVWGRGHFDGQMLGRDDVIGDGDLLEFHA